MFSGISSSEFVKRILIKNHSHIKDKTHLYSILALILQADKFSMGFL